MKQYQGKKIKVVSINGEVLEGLCCGANDSIVKILVPGEKDTRNVFVRNIYHYTVEGIGAGDGYSGIQLFVCKNEGIGCKGRRKLSASKLELKDLGCEAIKTQKMDCDFGCVGNIENVPSRALKVLLDGMIKIEKIGIIKKLNTYNVLRNKKERNWYYDDK